MKLTATTTPKTLKQLIQETYGIDRVVLVDNNKESHSNDVHPGV